MFFWKGPAQFFKMCTCASCPQQSEISGGAAWKSLSKKLFFFFFFFPLQCGFFLIDALEGTNESVELKKPAVQSLEGRADVWRRGKEAEQGCRSRLGGRGSQLAATSKTEVDGSLKPRVISHFLDVRSNFSAHNRLSKCDDQSCNPSCGDLVRCVGGTEGGGWAGLWKHAETKDLFTVPLLNTQPSFAGNKHLKKNVIKKIYIFFNIPSNSVHVLTVIDSLNSRPMQKRELRSMQTVDETGRPAVLGTLPNQHGQS